MTPAQDYGTLERGDGTVTVRFTRLLPHPPEKVWRALTEAEHLAAWFPTTIEGAFTPGAPLVFRFTELAMPPMSGRMISCEPPKLLEFTWDDETLRFELDAHESGTRWISPPRSRRSARRRGTRPGGTCAWNCWPARSTAAPTLLPRGSDGARCTRTTSPRSARRPRPSGRRRSGRTSTDRPDCLGAGG